MSREKATSGVAQDAHVLGRADLAGRGAAAGLGQHVVDHGPDHPAHRLQPQDAGRRAPDSRRAALASDAARSAASPRSSSRLKSPACSAVVHVVVVVGDVVGERGDLGLGRGPAVEPQVVVGVELGDRRSRTARSSLSVTGPLCLMTPSSVSQVRFRPVEARIAALQLGDHAEGLHIVVEAAVGRPSAPAARPRRRGRTADGRGRGPARWSRRGRRPGPAPWPASGRSAPPPGEWVRRVRKWSPSWATKTWVFSFSRRKAEAWMMRSRSRAKGVRVRLSAPATLRPAGLGGVFGVGERWAGSWRPSNPSVRQPLGRSRRAPSYSPGVSFVLTDMTQHRTHPLPVRRPAHPRHRQGRGPGR